MIRSITGLCMGLAVLTHSACAQPRALQAKYLSREGARPLAVGDKVPDFQLPEIMNFSARSGKLSSLRSRLTILDFWSTSCSSCIALFPHMQQLKGEFGDQLQIILVNGKTSLWHDTQEKIHDLLLRQQQRTGTGINLPIVLNATSLDDAFPWQTIPHEVWIDENNTVVAITGPNEVTSEHIRSILAGQKIRMHVKQDVDIDLQKTTLQEWYYGPPSTSQKALCSSTIIKGFIDGLHSQGIRYGDSSQPYLPTGWYNTNQTLFNLFCAAYADIIKVPGNQIVIETKNRHLFEANTTDSARYNNVYSYDVTVPASSNEKLLKYIQEDLARAFGMQIVIKSDLVECLVITPSASLQKSVSKGGEKAWETKGTSSRNYIHNYSAKEIIEGLNGRSPVSLIWSGGYDSQLDLELPADWCSPGVLARCLTDAGFSVTEEKRPMTVPVIIDVP